jgi:hypothetical protein
MACAACVSPRPTSGAKLQNELRKARNTNGIDWRTGQNTPIEGKRVSSGLANPENGFVGGIDRAITQIAYCLRELRRTDHADRRSGDLALDAEDAFEERAAIIHEGHTIAVAADGTPLAEPIHTVTVEEAEMMARADAAGHPIVAAALREFPGATIIAIRDHHDRLNDPQNPAAWE